MRQQPHFRLSSRVAATALLSFSIALAQQQGGGGGAQGGGAGGAQGGGAGAGGAGAGAGGAIERPGGQQPGGRTPTIPGQMPQDPTRDQRMPGMNDMQRVIYLSGKVMMEDGTPPPESVVIERVCNGIPRPEGHTDSKGRFSFQLGQNHAILTDASVGSVGETMPGRQTGIDPRELAGCEIRASLAGFRSDVVPLVGRRAFDNPDIGTIVLRRLAKVDGFTFSGTTAFAPKDARKAYEKGAQQNKKQKFAEAEKELMKAVTLYPKYAVAWYELGTVYQQQKKIEEARNAYGESIKADVKFVNPYGQLARLAAAEQKWDKVAEHTGTLIKLNPYYSPDVYFYSAVANYNLQKADTAEEHAREAAKQDTRHRNPKINHLLGVILAQKGDYKGAAENMRIYLKAVPDAADATIVKNQLAEMEKQAGGSVAAQAQ